MEDPSGEFSDGLDEFEESIDEKKRPPIRNQTAFKDKPYDEAFEVSQELSMAESFDGRDKTHHQQQNNRERILQNQMYDEAVEVSQSIDQSAANLPARSNQPRADAKSGLSSVAENKAAMRTASNSDDSKDAKGLARGGDGTRSQQVLNGRFDEALEFSHSGSEESIDTARGRPQQQQQQQQSLLQQAQQQAQRASAAQPAPASRAPTQAPAQQQPSRVPPQQQPISPDRKSQDESVSDDGEHDESYDHIEGAYNPRDFAHLNVSSDVKELFMYIERYKPQEVDLDTPLRCFIPEYIPAIGELDPFLKIPRPDGVEDGSGLKYLDEPTLNQSDPTVLELQLRAKSKKLQYGDVAVRSIENADKNPSKVDKWVQDINELHRTKPPPHVNYRRNMPDIDRLMEAWPEDFEKLLATTALPSPDLDLSLPEYVKVLCSILDIPVYDNPIESLHLMFSLYLEFKNNPHFQDRFGIDASADSKERGSAAAAQGTQFGGADVLELDSGADYK